MRVLGLVTARGGSKGFPKKNLARLAGRPLVVWAYRSLARLRDAHPELELFLSTDDPDIAAAWPEHPGRFRPAHLAGDEASSIDVVRYELGRFAEEGLACDAVLLLQPTSPLIETGDLEAMWRLYREGSESVIIAAEPDHPPQWCFSLDDRGRVEPVQDWDTAPRQQHPAVFRPAGAYLCSARFLDRYGAFIVPGETACVVVPKTRAVDIDEPADLAAAEAFLRHTRPEAEIDLGTRIIGRDCPVFIIAEVGVNHNGDPDLARRLIDAAARAGADAVKFQTFHAGDLATPEAGMVAYQQRNLRRDGPQADMLKALELPEHAFAALKAHAEEAGLVFLSSPFDLRSAELLCELGVRAFKIGSGELTNHPFLAELAAMGRPLIISTGMATLEEVEDAAAVVRGHGAPPTAWMHCVSAYPAPPEASNLRAMDTLRLALGSPVGMSDHTAGTTVAVAAVARGARLIEKHLTLSRDMPGPDHAASVEPAEFAEMVASIRLVESALGDGVKHPDDCELETITAARRSLVAARDLPAGHMLSRDDLACKRPASGLPPSMLEQVIGRRLGRAVHQNETLTGEVLEGPCLTSPAARTAS